MRISEISPEIRQPPPSPSAEPLPRILEDIESSITDAERLSPADITHSAPKLAAHLRRSLARLAVILPIPDPGKLQIWKLSYRLWNTCVDLANAAPKPTEGQAALRQIAADLISLAGSPAGTPSPVFKSAAFYHRTGEIWHELRKFDLAAACFEKATDLISKINADEAPTAEERRLLLDLNISRAETAWETGEKSLAIGLLNRSKSLLFRSADHCKTLAEQYLRFGKSILAGGDKSAGLNDAAKLIDEALNLCEKGLEVALNLEQKSGLKILREKLLRFLAATHLQGEEYESVVKCVKVIRESGAGEHPSVGFMAMRAWLGLRRPAEAEKELRGMVASKSVPDGICVSAVEAFFQETGDDAADAAKEVFLGLLGRCRVSAGAAVRVVHRMVTRGEGGDCGRIRARAALELVSDDRVAELFAGDGEDVAKQRVTLHAVIWNCAAEYFKAKDHEIAAEMFEKSMLYVPYKEENKVLRAKSFRVLCLCHLGLGRLDQAEEYINEAEKLDPNITSTFLKFKVLLMKKDETAAINQIQAMMNSVDFKADFLTLSAHEAMSSRALPVAVASLSSLLNLYATGKSMPIPEVTILRHIMALLLQSPGTETEILKFTKHARDRFFDLGQELFFGKGAVGNRELNWFSGHSWNMGIKMSKQKSYDMSAQFFEMAADFYEANGEGLGDVSRSSACKSLVLGVAATLAEEQQKNQSLSDTDVQKALQMVNRAAKLLPAISLEVDMAEDQTTSQSNMLFLHTFNSYELRGRMAGGAAQQLHVLKTFASSRACAPQHLFQIGLAASRGPRPNPEAADYAFRTCLVGLLLTAPSPDYKTVAMVLRRLVMVSGLRQAESDDELYAVYKEAYRIMVGLKQGEYPVDEGKWLAITAWNRSSMPARLGQLERAHKWMKMGLDFAQQVTGMDSYKCSMEKCLSSIEKSSGVATGNRSVDNLQEPISSK